MLILSSSYLNWNCRRESGDPISGLIVSTHWNGVLQAIRFPVLGNGFQQECLIGIAQFRRHYSNVSPELCLALFR
ncbi:DUF1488 family protein [Brenneria rubrifaciens]|uniref:DUF1488 family protein n=1 Tax=Brenneria rubrifaciens TaxID=55213 RepID=UPI001FED0DE5|nr:DUF1488 family protein [Brenneria rubrifaciens]